MYSHLYMIITNMISTSTFVCLLACFVTFLLLVIRWSKKPASLPVPTGSLPIIGHLHLLSGSELPHRVLAKLADKYGPLFKIRLGIRQVLVVSDAELAKQCLKTNDKEFFSIPKMDAFELLLYNCGSFAVSAFGPFWREMRKISTLELLSSHRSAALGHVWVPQVRKGVKTVYDKWVLQNPKMELSGSSSSKVVVEMRDWFGKLALNSSLNLVVGNSFSRKEDEDHCTRIFKQVFHLAGIITLSDALPFMRWFDIGGYHKQMKETAKGLDSILQGWLDSHRRNRDISGGEEKRDFMDVLINIFDKGDAKMFGYDADTIIKATTVTVVLGGADTMAVTVTWALCLLLNNPETLKKVQEELDTHVGRDRRLEVSDINNLAYLQAAMKETLRLYPPSPLLLPRESMSDTNVGGYQIEKGTMLFINAHKIQQNPLVWDDPCVFRPERFLTTHKHIDMKGHHFDLIPFSSGRRVCSGMSYALQVMPFMLALLVHSFDITTISNEPVDMSEQLGLTISKALPCEVILTPRLPHHLYENEA